MEPNDREFERIARRLDGEDVTLDERQEAAAREVRSDERRLAADLDVEVPPGAMSRVQARVTAELGRSRRRVPRFAVAGVAAGALAAAAVVLMLSTITTEQPGPAVPTTPKAEAEDVPLEVVLAANIDSVGPFEFDLLELELHQLRMGLTAADAPAAAMDAEMDRLQRQMEEFWLSDIVPDPLRI